MSRLPDFLILGAMKSATSTLHEQLARQPGFVLSTPKEPCFFSDDEVWGRGLEWYRALFAAAGPGDLCGESSTHYTKLPTYPRTIERIRSTLSPQARFVYVMRHPVDRLISHYIHEWSTGVIEGSIDAAVESHPELLHYGCYARQVRPYLEAFGPDRVLPMFFTRIHAEPQAELERLCRFLGYAGRPDWREEAARQNVSRDRMRPSAVRQMVMNLPGSTALRRTLLPRGLRERIKDRWRMKQRPQLSPSVLERVVRVFDQDLAELGELLGLELCCATFDDVTRDVVPAWARGS